MYKAYYLDQYHEMSIRYLFPFFPDALCYVLPAAKEKYIYEQFTIKTHDLPSFVKSQT